MKRIVFALFVFLVLPLSSMAVDVDYDIDAYYIEAYILENGDVQVSEIFLIDGSLNGYQMNLSLASSNSTIKASAISNVSVSGASLDEINFNTFEDSFTEYELVSYASVGESDKYVVNNTYNGVSISIYHPIDNDTYAFRLDYTIEDAIVMHDSFAEFYWNFFSGELTDAINNLNIRVILPGVDTSDYFRYWAHGPLSGEVRDSRNITTSYVYATIDTLDAYGTLDIRILFDDDLVTGVSNYSTDTFDEIIAYETALAEETNALRLEMQAKLTIATIGTVGFYIALVGLFIFIYIRYDKERKPIFNLKYNREFIDDYNVEVVDYLMNRRITENALSASIMNLIYKKNIKVEKIEEVKDEYVFTLVNRNKLNDTERALVEFLFDNVGKRTGRFTTTNLKKYASDTRTCQTFMNSYTKWREMVVADGEKEELFEKKKSYIIWPFILLIYSILLMSYIAYHNIELVFGVITVFFAIIFLIYTFSFSKKTQKGIEHYARWKAFKNFLNDFGNFKVKDLPEIVLWERYLVYATVFGLATKVEKAMNVKIKEFPKDADINYFALNYITNIHIANLVTSSMHSAINTSQMTINRVNANSSMSSGGGFGGGFSGGAGFGGGGRSGGGF